MRFPVAYSLLAVAGVVMNRHYRMTIVALVYFLLFWGVFLFFYAGSYNYGADDRFSLMTYPAIAILAGIGLWRLMATLGEDRPPHVRWKPIAAVAALLVQFLWYVPFVRAVGEEAWGARADVTFARNATRALPANSFVLSHNPAMFHVWGQSAAQVSVATTDPAYVERILAPRYAGGIFFNWGYWCDVDDPAQRPLCTAILDRYPHVLAREYRERDYRYAMYQLMVVPTDPPGRASGSYRRSDGRQ
jgi:asparagine N-glycosylation enzyme membrane subunit Stt3